MSNVANSHDPNQRACPHSGWIHRGDCWALRWNGRDVATVKRVPGAARVWLDLGKMWESREVYADSPEQGRSYAQSCAAAVLLPGQSPEVAAIELGANLSLPTLPELAGLPQGFRWIRPAKHAKAKTVVCYGEQWIAAIHQDGPNEPLNALLALHLDYPHGQRPTRLCTTLETGRRGLELWVTRNRARIVVQLQQAKRLEQASNSARKLLAPLAAPGATLSRPYQ